MHLYMRTLLSSLLIMPLSAAAQTVIIDVTNNQPAGGFSFTPIAFAFHDGTFDAFNPGLPASRGLAELAEVGNPETLIYEFNKQGSKGSVGVIAAADGMPQFTPGASGSLRFDVGDAAVQRYFSFAAMFVPSNDLFIGNDESRAHAVFDQNGNFLGPITIQIFGRDVWDAGTEVNDIMNGGNFVKDVNPMLNTPEGGAVKPIFDSSQPAAYFASLIGVQTPAGAITQTFTPDSLLATFTIKLASIAPTITSSVPADHSVDVLQDRKGPTLQGTSSIVLFSKPVVDAANGGALTPASFEISLVSNLSPPVAVVDEPPASEGDQVQAADAVSVDQGIVQPQIGGPVTHIDQLGGITDPSVGVTGLPMPVITSVTPGPGNSFMLTLDRPIVPGAWTRLKALVMDGDGVQASQNTIALGFLPGDANGDGIVEMQDLQALLGQLRMCAAAGTCSAPAALTSADMNRDGTVNTQDLLRLVQLLNGVQTQNAWKGVSLPALP